MHFLIEVIVLALFFSDMCPTGISPRNAGSCISVCAGADIVLSFRSAVPPVPAKPATPIVGCGDGDANAPVGLFMDGPFSMADLISKIT